jgi:putative flippase GtrA
MSGLSSETKLKVRFVIVGVWNTVFGYAVFCLLDYLFEHVFKARYMAYMSAISIAQVIAVINAFIFHKYYTFRSKAKNIMILHEFFKFSLTYTVVFAFNIVLLPVFVEIFHIQPRISGLIILFINTLVSYLGHSRFSFKNSST